MTCEKCIQYTDADWCDVVESTDGITWVPATQNDIEIQEVYLEAIGV